MRAVLASKGELKDITTDKPTPGEHDLLVQVKAVSVNPVDTKVRERAKVSGDDKILGWDAVGEVVAVGSKVTLFSKGDRVWYAGDVTRPGSNAEFQCVDERIAAKAPANLSDTQAAAMPLTAITAWELLFERLQIPRDDTSKDRVLLIVGAAGGVGSMLVQLARKLTKATVIGTASREASQTWIEELGAHYVLDHSMPLSAELAGVGVKDVTDVASLTHTDEHFNELVRMLRPQGRLALIDDPEQALDISGMKQKSLSLHWEFMFTRPMFKTSDIAEQHKLLSELSDLVDSGVINSTLGESMGTINAVNLDKAHQRLKTQSTIGKLVLSGF
ncbi:zinc-binding alcohol dehydrogenase family protein [Aliidiomarina minuta]|uniref:Zinc-type alcohol dehydrogenase-like protein n=1 Tax=Aliidiomarina minuta TaxID=880057 RepID=A0A432W3D1_9GAMM|nr:zinc-binding alcohol dehydrogenase family protein [Aliidiomarina minuta]RUO23848.1 zinc-binding alcohol dehydrogenase family protein [Aliidiomarina minuta]